LLTWGLAYTPVAYRDLGTAVRFKLQIIPILLGLIGFLIKRPLRPRAMVRTPDTAPHFALAQYAK